MKTIGERLREERKRLGKNQTDFAANGGVKKVAQINYEKDERHPDADYLAGVAEAGADVQYIVTGQTEAERLTERESRLLSAFRAADEQGKCALEAMAAALPVGTPPRQEVTGHGNVVAGGNISGVNTGGVSADTPQKKQTKKKKDSKG